MEIKRSLELNQDFEPTWRKFENLTCFNIFLILRDFAIKLSSFTNFRILFNAVVINFVTSIFKENLSFMQLYWSIAGGQYRAIYYYTCTTIINARVIGSTTLQYRSNAVIHKQSALMCPSHAILY